MNFYTILTNCDNDKICGIYFVILHNQYFSVRILTNYKFYNRIILCFTHPPPALSIISFSELKA